MSASAPVLLNPTVQNYSWGKSGEESIIPSLAGVKAESIPYAELWIGTHPKAPASVNLAGTSVDLRQYLGSLPESPDELPFLFKVLTIAKPLSIQTHPSKEEAIVLHKNDPEHYPDANHKPEIGVALSEVTLLYGFKSLEHIKALSATAPELSSIDGFSFEGSTPGELYNRLLGLPVDSVNKASKELVRRLSTTANPSELERWILAASKEYPEGDVGLFAFYFLNLVTLAPGQGIFIAPHILHAYVSGDLVECMANSDNVVRAGLTPKFKDVDTLVRLVDCSECIPAIQDSGRASRYEFETPAREFTLSVLKQGSPHLLNLPGLSLLFSASARGSLTVSGQQKVVEPGLALLFPDATEVELSLDEGLMFLASPGNG